ncbi:MAG: hypothetical protein Q7S98_00870 [Deltaproteobacteria bacterium]|nr:hypothetical protein [Deltaproteobacteria bacterium]
MVDCIQPKNNWERYYCEATQGIGPSVLNTVATATELARSRYFSQSDWLIHTGVHVSRPRFGTRTVQVLEAAPGFTPLAPAESASAIGMAYLEHPWLRVGAHYGVRSFGLFANLLFVCQPISRMTNGDSTVEGTWGTDASLMLEAGAGLFAILYPTRLGRGIAAHAVLGFAGVGLAQMGQDVVRTFKYGDTSTQYFKATSTQISLMALNYVLGMGGRLLPGTDPLTGRPKKGRYQQLVGDVRAKLDIRADAREGRWQLAKVERVRVELSEYDPRILTHPSPSEGKVLVRDTTFVGYEQILDPVTGDKVLTAIGTFETHQPLIKRTVSGTSEVVYEDVGLPDVTARIHPEHQGKGHLVRFRNSLLRHPEYHDLKKGWVSYVWAGPELWGEGGEQYIRSVDGSPVFVAARRMAWEYEPDHLTGEPVRHLRGMVHVAPNHRTTNRFWRADFWTGLARNTGERWAGHRTLSRRIEQSGLYRGAPDHPQVTSWVPWLKREQLARQASFRRRWTAEGIQPGSPDVSWLRRIPEGMRSRPQQSPRDYLRELRGRRSGS